ncbi:MAG: DJ-1/PfpI family protein [Bacilli bacterium]|jgi:putative intracellular protease/amidase
MKILSIITDGFEEVEFGGTIGILRRANLDVDVFALKGTTATGRYGVTVSDLKDISELNINNYDMLFICGGPEYILLEASDLFQDVLSHFYNNNKYIAAICAGPTLLGHRGMLKNKHYTCFSSMNENFGGFYEDHYYVIDKKIITGKSAAAVIDFAFAIVETIKSKEYANQIRNSIYYFNK